MPPNRPKKAPKDLGISWDDALNMLTIIVKADLREISAHFSDPGKLKVLSST
jgi:hypothetical protein